MANWTTSRITNSRTGVSSASSSEVAPRDLSFARPCPRERAGIASPVAGRDAVRGRAHLASDDRADRDGDGGEDAGDDGPFDGGRAAAAAAGGLGAQPVQARGQMDAQIDDRRVVQGVDHVGGSHGGTPRGTSSSRVRASSHAAITLIKAGNDRNSKKPAHSSSCAINIDWE